MIVQDGVPGDGIPNRWPCSFWLVSGKGSGWTRLQSDNYWSGTEYSQSNAWNFNTNNGNQNNDDKNNALFAVAVRSGG